MAWRLAHSLEVLRDEVNARWPGRSTASDGTLGDQSHAARHSDHNPDANGVVRAMDITANGIDPNWYAEHLRAIGARGDRRLNPGGYVIWNRRIASSTHRPHWQWHPYTGSNGHTHHIHLSVSTEQAGYDFGAPWGIAADPGELTMDAEAKAAFARIEDAHRKLNARLDLFEKDRWKPTTLRVRKLFEKAGLKD